MLPPKVGEFICTISLVNGDPITIKGEADETKRRNVASRIEEMLDSNYIAFEFGDKLTIIPTRQIQKIDISPAPGVVMARVVKGFEEA